MSKTPYTHPQSAEQLRGQLDQLDELLIELGRDPTPEASLVLEHLAAIRTCLIDGLAQELALNLDLAEESSARQPNRRLNDRTQQFLKSVRGAR